MANQKKLGKATTQRMALLKNQVSNLLWYGKIETTLDRAKAVSRMAEKLLTVAIKTYNDEVEVTKKVQNEAGQTVEKNFVNDGPKKLAARRKLMANLYDIQENSLPRELRSNNKEIKHPLIEKIFREYAPKYAKRIEEKGIGGGYTSILKLGTRRGDNAEMAIIRLVD